MTRRLRLVLLFLVVPPLFLLFLAMGGWVVMQLWNWLLPPLFGVSAVTFWQALGLLALCRILFGGFGGHGGSRRGWRGPRRCDRLTDEERDGLRERIRARVRDHLADDPPGA